MLEETLKQVQAGELSIESAKEQLASYENLGYAKIDHHRIQRTGFPEIVYGEGKTSAQIISIMKAIQQRNDTVLTTRVSPEKASEILLQFPDFTYDECSRLVYLKSESPPRDNYIAVVCAGTSDLHVAEEAAITAEVLGSHVHRIYDVGVSGLHRLLNHLKDIQGASATVVVAGMEGALASVVGGLVSHPIIAVPTSVGYGANFQGVSALLAMLNACSPGISVVNIDNGFGAAYNAVMIDQLAHHAKNK